MTDPRRPPVELRSDTFTLPTPGMKEAMLRAELGDDVWGEDPTVQALEATAAARFGLEAGLFCPSGTMSNQIALAVHLRPGDAVICADVAHVHLYEGGGIAAHTGATTHLVPSDRGRFGADAVRAAIQPDDPHAPRTRLVSVEDTCNRGGGAIWASEALDAVADVCRGHGLTLHLDGARVMNRLVATGEDPRSYARRFDSVSLCLSKGLGAPVGSVLLGREAFIREARRVRKRMGGGMRQAGMLAAAGLYALEHHVERLAEDHRRARALASAVAAGTLAEEVLPVETNIVLFEPRGLTAATLVARLEAEGVRASSLGSKLRFVTHLGVDDTGVERAISALARVGRAATGRGDLAR